MNVKSDLHVRNTEQILFRRSVCVGYAYAEGWLGVTWYRFCIVVAYTNVPKFKNWIVDTVRQSRHGVGEAENNAKVNLECFLDYGNINHK